MKGLINNLWFSFTFATIPLLTSVVLSSLFVNQIEPFTIVGFNWMMNLLIYFLVFRKFFESN